MLKAKNILTILVLLLSLSAAVFSYYSIPKIAYVNNAKLISNYQGFKDSQREYQKSIQQMQANLDTLSKRFGEEVNDYKEKKDVLSDSEKQLTEKLLQSREKEVLNYKRAIEEKALEQEQALTAGVINQINSFVIEFGKSHHYDYVIGVTETGNLLYAKEDTDITTEVIEAINEQYQGQ